MQAARDSEIALFEGLRARDPEAYARLYDQFGRRVFGLAYRILGDRDAAEDAVQDAFLSLWQHADRLDASRGRLAPLMLAVVHHKASDQLRRRTPSGFSQTYADDRAATRPSVDPADVTARRMERSDLLRAIAVLPREQQQTIELAYFDGQSHSEIALATRAPLGTVKSRLRIALQHLRLILGT